MHIQTIKIETFTLHEHHLEVRYRADAFTFSTNIFYHDVSFSRLAQRYPKQLLETISAYIALFEGMKLCSLFPTYYDISSIAAHIDEAAIALFVEIYQGVFGQHWYENNVTDYRQPEVIVAGGVFGQHAPVPIVSDQAALLVGCGGGKDSIVAMKLLHEADVPFASMQYAHSCYGKADQQHALIDSILACVKPIARHALSIFDDFADFPFMHLYFPENSGIIAPETPVSIFESLFLMLDGGYTSLCFAHEKSANTGNMVWDRIGKEINHQWGKSFAAERLIDRFIRAHIVSNVQYFSILQPIYDIRIFQKLRTYPDVLTHIHSCNERKPWCKKCPKCAYVWLGLMAFCDRRAVDAVFQSNLFDDADLLPIFRRMMGLADHTPFECIGEINETRLMLRRCSAQGLAGKALSLFERVLLSDPAIDWQALERMYAVVYETEHAIPAWLFARIRAHL